MKPPEYLRRQTKPVLLCLNFVLALLMGIVDYLTGPEISFSIFYLIPISIVAWLAGVRAGIMMSVASAALWFAADLWANPSYSHPAIPYWNAGVRLGFFLIVTHAISALRASQQRREELAQFIVHDLRSPLSNVITGLQTIQEFGGETMDAVQKDLVEMCLVSGRRMLMLVTSLLDLAQLESGHMPLDLGAANVKELVESSLRQVTVWARRNRVTLASQMDTSVETVWADSAVTARVLVNLLSNAIKFSGPESTVTIRVAPSDAGVVVFSVTDQGRGIPQEWVGKVFDKFAQVGDHGAKSVAGSGLGLAFCRLAVQAQGGRIGLESEVGKGTTVTFTLPGTAG